MQVITSCYIQNQYDSGNDCRTVNELYGCHKHPGKDDWVKGKRLPYLISFDDLPSLSI